jgi:hypothetical protein
VSFDMSPPITAAVTPTSFNNLVWSSMRDFRGEMTKAVCFLFQSTYWKVIFRINNIYSLLNRSLIFKNFLWLKWKLPHPQYWVITLAAFPQKNSTQQFNTDWDWIALIEILKICPSPHKRDCIY